MTDFLIIHQAAFASQNLEDLAIYDAAGDQCCECGKSMTLAGHYVAYLCCTKCRFPFILMLFFVVSVRNQVGWGVIANS